MSGHNCFHALFCSLIKNTQESLHAKNIHKALFCCCCCLILFKINISFAHIWMSMLRAFIQLTGSTGISFRCKHYVNYIFFVHSLIRSQLTVREWDINGEKSKCVQWLFLVLFLSVYKLIAKKKYITWYIRRRRMWLWIQLMFVFINFHFCSQLREQRQNMKINGKKVS
jgi:hypothetical protein